METRYLFSSKVFQILHRELLRQEGLLPYSPHGKLIEMGNRCVQGGRAERYLLGQNTNVYSKVTRMIEHFHSLIFRQNIGFVMYAVLMQLPRERK